VGISSRYVLRKGIKLLYIGQTQGHFGQQIFATPQTPVKLNRKGAGLSSNLGKKHITVV
jgi:hypothetical protein